MKNRVCVRNIRTYPLIFLSLLLTVLSSSVFGNETKLQCDKTYYKMVESLFGFKKDFYKRGVYSADGWKPVCDKNQQESISGDRVTCSSKISHWEYRINYNKPITQAKKYTCPETGFPPSRPFFDKRPFPKKDPSWKMSNAEYFAHMATWKMSNAEYFGSVRVLYHPVTTKQREEHFKDIGCSFYGDPQTIYAVETKELDDWLESPIPAFYPFSRTNFERQVFGEVLITSEAISSRAEVTIDFDVPRKISETIKFDTKTLKPRQSEATTIKKCGVVEVFD